MIPLLPSKLLAEIALLQVQEALLLECWQVRHKYLGCYFSMSKYSAALVSFLRWQ